LGFRPKEEIGVEPSCGRMYRALAHLIAKNRTFYSSSRVIFVKHDAIDKRGRSMLLAYDLTRLDHCTQHHFMAPSSLSPPLPALEDLIALTPRRSSPKKIGPRLTRDIRRDILLLCELNDYEDESEYTYKRITELLSKRYERTVTQRAIQQT